MAKLFKISAYVADPMDEFNDESLKDCLYYCTKNDITLKHLSVDSVNISDYDQEEYI